MKLAGTKRRRPGICAMALILCMILSLGSPEPEICALCGNGEGQRYHAPCVLECSAGLLAELAVYEPAKGSMRWPTYMICGRSPCIRSRRAGEYTVTVCEAGEHYQVEVTAELF